jgi:hypothetical protein
LTGADLKAVVEDAKLLFAHHQATQKEARPVEDYFLKAIATIRANRASYGRRKSAGWAGNSIGFKAEQD